MTERPPAFLEGGGAMAELIASNDWSTNLLGPISTWPSNLKTLLATMLRARHPMLLWWGPELVQFYNDSFRPSLGVGKHPSALGQRGRESWAEVWPIVGAQIERVMSHGESIWSEDALVPIMRNGRIEEVHWTYGYSPVIDDTGRIAGTLIVCNETTARVVAQRRLGILRALVGKTADCRDVASVMDAAYAVIATAKEEIPFAISYRLDEATRTLRRERSTEMESTLLESIDALMQSAPSEPTLLSLPSLAFPGGPWPEAASQAFVLPLKRGLTLVLGLSPRLPFDATYRELMSHFREDLDSAFARVQAEEILRSLVDNLPELAWSARADGHLDFYNRRWYEYTGTTFEQMQGWGWQSVHDPTMVEAVSERWQKSLETGEPFEMEFPLRGADGKFRWFLTRIRPLRDGTGKIVRWFGVNTNIHERKELLRQLESASIAKDEFLATVSHELRTPLTAILGWSRILGDGSEPAYIQKGLAVIDRNAKAQAQLIDDLLDVSRIISGKIRMSMKRVELAAVVNAAVETTQPSAIARGVRLNVILDPSLGDITADEDRLQQVIWNLLSNAVKFTPNGGEVSLRATREDSRVMITVSDTGKGIAPSFLPNVFDRFRQDDSSTTKQHAGLGLGLAIVRHLVELHGGTVSARSDGEGKGSSFDVHLPIRAVEARVSSPPLELDAPESQAATEVPGRLRGVHVLVVDDQEDARDLVATVLEIAGATVTQADSVSSAMKCLATDSISVIVSDIGMPGEDGYALLQRIRASGSPRARGVPALALTAYARTEDRDKALASGFQEHVAKPIDPAHLVDEVARLARR